MREMKDSGINWVGTIPFNWNVNKIKYALIQRTENNNPILTTDILSLTAKQGVVPLSEKEGGGNKPKEDITAYRLAYPGDIVMNSMNVLSGSVGLSRYFGCVSPVYYMLRPANPKDDVRFYNYLFQTTAFQKSLFGLGNGILIKESENGKLNTIRMRIPMDKLGGQYIPIADQESQNRISDFLDSKCAKIDSLAADIQTGIDTLDAYKRAVITEAVTKGLDKNAPMKDSGIEWVGEIPSNWETLNIKRIYDRTVFYPIGDGDHGLIKPSDYIDEGIPYIRVQNLGFCTPLKLSNVVYISHSKNERIKSSTLRPNDVLFAKTGATIGKTGIIPVDIKFSNTTSHIGKITVAKEFNARYVYYVLSSYIGYKQFWDIALLKSTRPELSIEETKRIFLTIPKSRKKQDEVVLYLDTKCAEIDALIAQKQEQLDILAEYKKSVIYEYVTGKKEVPENGKAD